MEHSSWLGWADPERLRRNANHVGVHVRADEMTTATECFERVTFGCHKPTIVNEVVSLSATNWQDGVTDSKPASIAHLARLGIDGRRVAHRKGTICDSSHPRILDPEPAYVG